LTWGFSLLASGQVLKGLFHGWVVADVDVIDLGHGGYWVSKWRVVRARLGVRLGGALENSWPATIAS
jgi:hypothetical protein